MRAPLLRPRVPLVCALLAAVPGCDRPDDGDQARRLAQRALGGVLVYPRSFAVRVTAGEQAAELVLSTSGRVDSVAAWYRATLRANGWELKHEATTADGSVVLYAERSGRPLWIRLRANDGAPGTTYTLIGVAVAGDSVR